MNNLLVEKIDNYLLGKMNEEDRQLFEEELSIDPTLQKKVEQQKLLLETLFLHDEYIDLKKTVSNFNEPSFETLQTKANDKQIKGRRFQKVLSIINIAACIAILVSLGVFLTTDWYNKRDTENYALLSEEVKDLSTKHRGLRELVHDIIEKDNRNGSKQLIGTCFPITKDGFLITSYHLIGRAKKITVEFSSDLHYSAKIVHSDIAHDLALLFIDDTSFTGFNKLPYGISNNSSLLGSDVYTLGYPKKTIVYNEGTVSSLSGYRDDSLSYQLSIPVNPGNSGAPVFDKQGNVIGIIHGKHTENEGVAFAVKSEYLLEAAENIPNYYKEIEGKIVRKSNLSYKNRVNQIKSITPYILRLKVRN